MEFDLGGNGYHQQAAEVMRCMRSHQLESPIMPLAETVEIMETMDRIREGWGLRYPMDPPPVEVGTTGGRNENCRVEGSEASGR